MKNNWKKGWKVIGIGEHNKRESYIESEYSVSYRKNKIARPLPYCGPLAVFKFKKYAEIFASAGEDTKIVPCLYLESKDKALWTPISTRQIDFPEGTILADKVKCLE
jgi:hypothetical protein